MTIQQEQKEKDFLVKEGFTYNCELNAYVLPITIKNKSITLGNIVVRFFGTGFITPIFRSTGVTYLSLPTLEHIADLIDYYDRKLTRMEADL